MSRKRQLAINLIIIVALSFFYMRSFERYFFPEGVFYASEKGLLYGPSEEILMKYENGDGSTIIVGRCGDSLSAVSAERKLFWLWGQASGPMTGLVQPNYENGESMVFVYHSESGIIMGLTNNTDAAYVHVLIYDWERDKEYAEYDIPVEENGFFFMDGALKADEEIFAYTASAVDRDGNVLERVEG